MSEKFINSAFSLNGYDFIDENSSSKFIIVVPENNEPRFEVIEEDKKYLLQSPINISEEPLDMMEMDGLSSSSTNEIKLYLENS